MGRRPTRLGKQEGGEGGAVDRRQFRFPLSSSILSSILFYSSSSAVPSSPFGGGIEEGGSGLRRNTTLSFLPTDRPTDAEGKTFEHPSLPLPSKISCVHGCTCPPRERKKDLFLGCFHREGGRDFFLVALYLFPLGGEKD